MKEVRMTAYDVALEREAQQLTGREVGIYGPCPPSHSTRNPFGNNQAVRDACRPLTSLVAQHHVAQAMRTTKRTPEQEARAATQRAASLKANAAKAARLAKAEADAKAKRAAGKQENLSTVSGGPGVDTRTEQVHYAPVTCPRLSSPARPASQVAVSPIAISAFDDESVKHVYTFIQWD